MTRVLYLAARVAGDVPGNLARARRWLAWLCSSWPTVAWIAPWLTWLELAPEADADPERRAAGLALDVAVLERCDGIVLVGGRLTAGMVRELGAARAAGLEVLGLLALGDEPPDAAAVDPGIARQALELLRRVDRPDDGRADRDAVDPPYPEEGQRVAPDLAVPADLEEVTGPTVG